MHPATLLLHVLILGLATHQGALATWWMNLPYGNEDYNYLVLFGHNVSMECNDTFVTNNHQVLYWVRPDLTVMRANDSEYFWTIDGTAGWQVNSNGYNLHVYTLQESQFGFYHCVLENVNDGTLHVVKKAINYHEAYFGDLWPKYRRSTIIAGGSAGGFLVLSIIILLICRFKYDPEEDSDDDVSLVYSLKDGDDPMEGGSSSNSGSSGSGSDIKKAGIPPDGPQVYANEALDVEKDVRSPGVTEIGSDYTVVGLHKEEYNNVDTTAF